MSGGQTKFAGAWLSHVDTNGQKISEGALRARMTTMDIVSLAIQI